MDDMLIYLAALMGGWLFLFGKTLVDFVCIHLGKCYIKANLLLSLVSQTFHHFWKNNEPHIPPQGFAVDTVNTNAAITMIPLLQWLIWNALRKKTNTIPTMWGPLVVSWFITPSNYCSKHHKPYSDIVCIHYFKPTQLSKRPQIVAAKSSRITLVI